MVEHMSEMKNRMLAGEPYRADDAELVADKLRCAQLVQRYNTTEAGNDSRRSQLLELLLGSIGRNTVIRAPVYFDYGRHTTIGDGTFLNFGAVILDVGRVDIGSDVQVGPNVQFLTPTHPMDPIQRRAGWEAQKPVVVADGVWLGGGVIICPGVTIGMNSVIGAGSVVTRDVPAGVLAVGESVPCGARPRGIAAGRCTP
jgi:maltose O-acetyltransferase